MKKRHTFKLVVIVLITASIALKIIWSLPYHSQQVWQGYQVAMVGQPDQVDLDTLAANLKQAGFSRIISYSDQKVTLFRYFGESSLHTVPLQSVPQLLEPQDPRYDPYLNSLPEYCRGQLNGDEAVVLYLEHREGDFGTLLKGRSTLSELGVPYYLSGLDPLSQIVLWACVSFTLIATMILFPKEFRIKGSLLLWAAGVTSPLLGTVHLSMSSFTWWLAHLIGWTLLTGWAGPAMKRYLNSDSEDRFFLRALKKYVSLYAGTVLVGIIAGQIGSDAQIGLILSAQSLLSLCIQAGLLYAFYGIHKQLSRRQLHSLFVPVSITAKRQLSGPAIRSRVAVFIFVAGLIPLAALPIFGTAIGETVEYPVPVGSENRAAAGIERNSVGQADEVLMSWEELSAAVRSQAEGGNKLPDLTDYLKHRAFQEGYFYGRPYVFPEPGEKITIPVYRREGIEVFSRDKVVKMFTDDWYKDIIGFAYNNGVPRLLLAQGEPVQVQVGTVEPFRIGTYAIFGHIGALLILVPVVFFIVSRKMISQSFFNEKQQLKKGQKVA